VKTRIIIVVVAILVGGGATVALLARSWSHGTLDTTVTVPAYCLPSGTHCTVLCDFVAARAALDSMEEHARAIQLVRRMVEDFRVSADAKASDAKTIELKAVYIIGKDNYQRPDFSKRVELVKVSGTREQMLQLSTADLGDWDRLKQAVSAEIIR
jgi:hypothetical protein